MVKRAAKPGLDAMRAVLRAAGLRCTPARLAVLEHLASAQRPLSHAEVDEALAARGFDRATVYRNLIELADAELVSRIELGDHVWRFELRRQAGHEADHPHFVCVDCGEVSCLPSLEVSLSPKLGARAARIGQVTEILLKGHCQQCETG